MPKKVRELIKRLEMAGFRNRGGKGSHRNFTHPQCPFVVTISGKEGEDAKPYQEKAIHRAIKEVKSEKKR